MDTKDHPVISILGDQKRFVVPIYQRRYSWRDDRLAAFWEDVVAKAEEALEGSPKFSHYMGALILAPGANGYTIGATPRMQVVDGQQRLTTFQLFLVALREVGAKLHFPEIGRTVQNYLFNHPMSGDGDNKEAVFKLIPTPEDKPIFQMIVEHGLSAVRKSYPQFFFQNGRGNKGKSPNAVNAVAFFSDRIETYARFGVQDEESESGPLEEEDVQGQRRRLRALMEALLNHLKLVVITLAENDDAQVIFETLNSKAEPLLAMDLVRNSLFHRASAQGESAEALFEAKWRPWEADPFWKADAPGATPRRPRVDHFLSHALAAQTAQRISVRELYAEYRAFTRPNGRMRFDTVEKEPDALLAFAPTCRSLEEGGGDPVLASLGIKLRTWDVTTAYPIVFCIATSSAYASVKERLYQLIYAYVVRRAVCGLTPKHLNQIFPRLVRQMLDRGVSLATFADAFAKQTGPAVRFPSDEEFRRAIQRNPLYEWLSRKERLIDILWELECASRTKYSVNTPRPESMSIEHVLPQSWTATWPLPDGRYAPADASTGADGPMLAAIEARQSALHTLGNLTLITVPANAAASNAAFPKKAQWLKQSLLALNLAILEKSVWREREINERGNALADLAVKIWPSPTSA